MQFAKSEKAATAIEYAFIASMIAVAIAAVVLGLGVDLRAAFQKVSDSFNH